MNNVIVERINQIRNIMAESRVDVYMVCTGDYHMSEYAGEYFGEREYLSGFTGSAGTLVITGDDAALFTDGRYYVQAEKELEGTGIELMRSGMEGVPTVKEYCVKKLKETGCSAPALGMDGRTVSASLGGELELEVSRIGGIVNGEFNGVEVLWKDRPEFPMSTAYEIECGESRESKLARLAKAVKDAECECHVIASLDDICWLFNIRGDDVRCNPVIMAYAMVGEDGVVLYTDDCRLADVKPELERDGVDVKPYGQVYKDCEVLAARGKRVLVDSKRVNYALVRSLWGAQVVDRENPTVLMKAVKNDYEIQCLKDVHVEDGLAVTRFIYWLKCKMSKGEPVTEVECARYLDGLRGRINDFADVSFDTISAYGANAAMMHYHAKPEACSVLKAEGMLLVDSGGQYRRGTTDVTRTIALGPVTDKMKRHYTLALKGMLALTDAHFLKGCTGYNLDILARQPLWEEGVDYRCGTGHGVGFMLNVHEAPNGFRWKHMIGRNDLCVIEPGMVTSNEPGVYIDGEYGIRIENEIICVKDYANEYGEFLKFETLTCVPLEPELIDMTLFDKKDKERLNKYNDLVYTLLSPHLNGEELEFLKNVTRNVE